MTRSLRLLLPGGLAIALSVAALVLFLDASAQEDGRTTRAFAPMLAADGIELDPLPPADPSYCGTPSPDRPPGGAILGLFTIAGAQAPQGTIIQLVFDGKAGPAERTKAAGGYSIIFELSSGDGCSNRVGSNIALRVNGTDYATGRVVEDGVITYNLAIP